MLYFGTYSRGEEYSRNEAIIGGLLHNNVELIECREDLWGTHEKKMEGVKKGLISQVLTFARAYLKLILRFLRTEPFDIMAVGYIGHIDMFPARLLKMFHRKPIVFDAGFRKFSANWKVGYSQYLTMLYGLKNQKEFDDKYKKKVESWNRVLGRIAEDKDMTKKNLGFLDEMKAEGFDVDLISEVVKEGKDERESSEEDQPDDSDSD